MDILKCFLSNIQKREREGKYNIKKKIINMGRELSMREGAGGEPPADVRLGAEPPSSLLSFSFAAAAG